MSLRDAAQQALDALKLARLNGKNGLYPGELEEVAAIITALEAALAEPTVPSDCADSHQPVAWMYRGIRHDGTLHENESLIWRPEYMDIMSEEQGAKATPLYAHPPQRQPLTIDEVEQIRAQHDHEIHGDRVMYIVRMTEKAHGIGGDK